ncbi:hypothetical protein H7X69_00715 [Candidatus Saccharibacteria bacterium]|nr:hypothetical protein [Candidatus Saccharibacteria bacterium]
MNAERSVFVERDFYGPLELASANENRSDRYIMLHPNDPTKLVRAGGGGTYLDKEEMNERVGDTLQVLKGLSEHGVAHVKPSYIDETSESGQPYLITVVDKLDNIRPYDEIIASPELNAEQIEEADLAISHMLSYAAQTIREGGYIDPEMMHLDQFVYDVSRPEGERMVLVDVEAIGAFKVDSTADSMKNGFPTALVRTVAELCVDIINLANRSEHLPASLPAAVTIIEALPGESPETNEAKMALLYALDTNEISPEIANLANGVMMDDKDDW